MRARSCFVPCCLSLTPLNLCARFVELRELLGAPEGMSVLFDGLRARAKAAREEDARAGAVEAAGGDASPAVAALGVRLLEAVRVFPWMRADRGLMLELRRLNVVDGRKLKSYVGAGCARARSGGGAPSRFG